MRVVTMLISLCVSVFALFGDGRGVLNLKLGEDANRGNTRASECFSDGPINVDSNDFKFTLDIQNIELRGARV